MPSEARIIRREKRSERKIQSGYSKSPEEGIKAEKKWGYNYKGAEAAGITPDETGHWASRNPETGEIFKGRKHPTIMRTKKAEKKLGYKIIRKGDTLYSQPKK